MPAWHSAFVAAIPDVPAPITHTLGSSDIRYIVSRAAVRIRAPQDHLCRFVAGRKALGALFLGTWITEPLPGIESGDVILVADRAQEYCVCGGLRRQIHRLFPAQVFGP